MKKIYICHAGAGVSDYAVSDRMGIVGMAYFWEGEWIRSPEEVEGREVDAIMKLRPVFGPHIEIWGDLSCYSSPECLENVKD